MTGADGDGTASPQRRTTKIEHDTPKSATTESQNENWPAATPSLSSVRNVSRSRAEDVSCDVPNLSEGATLQQLALLPGAAVDLEVGQEDRLGGWQAWPQDNSLGREARVRGPVPVTST